MINEKRVLSIIPARGGSKGIKNKNIVTILNKPLIQYTLDEAKKSRYIDKIYISTDSQHIANVCERLGHPVEKLRPASLALDETKTIDVVINVINELNSKGEKYDYIVLLQPTQPLRQAQHIDEAIELIFEKKETSLVSVTPAEENPVFMRTIDSECKLHSVLSVSSTIRRQELDAYFIVNGAIYINEISTIKPDTSLNDNSLAYIMDKEYHLDIDEYKDLEKFRRVLTTSI